MEVDSEHDGARLMSLQADGAEISLRILDAEGR